eukprot:6461833-Prorocentrum_lima.AAC.1
MELFEKIRRIEEITCPPLFGQDESDWCYIRMSAESGSTCAVRVPNLRGLGFSFPGILRTVPE